MKAFLSYTHDDFGIAQKVRNYLVHHQIEVFDDRNEIATGDSLVASINHAINHSDTFLFFVSHKSEKSLWANQELSIALSKKMKGEKAKLIPIIIDKNAEIPFFLRDYVYLDLTSESNFDSSMSKLLSSISSESKTSYGEDLAAKASNIELEKRLLSIRSIEHAEHQKFKTRQMFIVSMIATLVSAVAASIGLLGWLAKIDYLNFEWLIAFIVGAVASMVGSILYMQKEKPHTKELLRKIEELKESLQQKEAQNDNK